MVCSTLVCIQNILPIEEGASTIYENVLGIVLCYFGLYDRDRRARYFYEAQKALLLFAKRFARWMHDKPVTR